MQYRTKQLLISKFRRAIRWEFWPMSIFYIPVCIYILFLSFRYKGLTFLSVNPGMPMSGLIGERKATSLEQLKGSVFLAQFIVLKYADDLSHRIELAYEFMQDSELSFPIVMKPDFGQRGLDVAVIRSNRELEAYLSSASGDVIIQEHVEGEEFGVFYYRLATESKGEIFSITEKTFPVLIGDGIKSLERLIMENPRTHYMLSLIHI